MAPSPVAVFMTIGRDLEQDEKPAFLSNIETQDAIAFTTASDVLSPPGSACRVVCLPLVEGCMCDPR